MSTFRDPIIYPGEPMPAPLPGRWGRVEQIVRCIAGEYLLRGEVARWTESGWQCREHAVASVREAA